MKSNSVILSLPGKKANLNPQFGSPTRKNEATLNIKKQTNSD